MPKELYLAPPNTAGKQAEGKPLLAIYKEESAERWKELWDGAPGTLGAPRLILEGFLAEAWPPSIHI